ncbi:flagellar biosynthetic protein FliQ [Vicingaceae bacterium]|nr:flagellar biosynthetic protein FliQ [Vicingaceae bacterium]
MDSQAVVDLTRDALMNGLMLMAPPLVAALAIGLLVAFVQTVTNMHDQTVAFIPKLVGVVFVLSLCLPWLIDRVSEYSRDTFSGIPSVISQDNHSRSLNE